MKIRKGDTVQIMSGKDRGKKGKVLRAFPEESRILVEGINIRKKHQRPKKSGEKGQIISMPGAIAIAKAKLVCPNCGKAARVGFKNGTNENKNKLRYCKKCNQEIS